MKIALIGTPGSGKTDLAHALDDATVIDDYAQEVAERGDWAIGFSGGYLTNLAVALERHSLERSVWESEGHTVTCGTVIESSVYMALHFEESQRYLNEGPDRAAEMQRIQASMEIFACIFMDTFKYDRVYYLPPVKAIEENEERMKKMDQHLQAAFQAFDVKGIQPLVFEQAGSLPELTLLRAQRVREDLVEDGNPAPR